MKDGKVINVIWDDYCAGCTSCHRITFTTEEDDNYDNDTYDEMCNVKDTCLTSDSLSCETKVIYKKSIELSN